MSIQPYIIEDFWKWFSRNSDIIKSHYLSENALDLSTLLDDRITSLWPGLVWEIGPSKSENLYFAVSPAGDQSRLCLTHDVIMHAPKLPGWEFYPAKPPKEWHFQFSVFGEAGRTIHVDASDWRYSLSVDKENKLFFIVFYTKHFPDLDLDKTSHLAFIVAEGAIGEQLMLRHVGSVDLLHTPTRDFPKTGNIKRLKEHLETLLDQA